MFTITKHWLIENSSSGSRGGWTKAQLEAVGIGWPPPKGWADALIGSMVEDEQREKFERLGKEYRMSLVRERAKAAERYEQMSQEIYYTWPTASGFEGSFQKPVGWWR